LNKPLSKIETATRLMTRPEGATMDEILAATGGSYQYNAKRRLEARGYAVTTRREGRATRYFAVPPAAPVHEATVTSQGQVTIPKEVRERLALRKGKKLRFILRDDGRVEIAPATLKLSDLIGILGKPPRSATLEEMDEAVAQGAVERFLRSTR
jgi:AbrB family looped-hinge helix DNA binding protein